MSAGTRRWLGVLVIIGLVLVLRRPAAEPAPLAVSAPAATAAPPVAARPVASVAPAVDGAPEETEPTPLAAIARDMARDCDLPVRTVCGGRGCVGTLETPSLDGLGGWLSITRDRPRFVLATALRDLGGGVDASPCGGAIDALLGGWEVRVVARDGGERWCLGPRDDPGLGARCDAALGSDGWASYADPRVRKLVFDR